jgi:DNA-binding Lrp family transcriptional regulator
MKNDIGSGSKGNEKMLLANELQDLVNSKEYFEESEVLNASNDSKAQSRHELIKEIEEFGVNAQELNVLTIEGLKEVLDGLHSLVASYKETRRVGRPRKDPNSIRILSELDKKIICQMLESGGHVSSLSISRELDIPLSTIQRRRSRLDETLVERSYSLKVEKLGWKRGILLISVSSGNTVGLGKEILECSDMVESVYRMNGDSIMDLRAEIIFKSNSDLVTLMDQIKTMPGVRTVVWGECMQLIGRNENTTKRVIGSA